MKNNILIGVFVSFWVLFGIIQIRQEPNKRYKKVTLNDTIKAVDSIVIDTIAYDLVPFQENAHASYYHDRFTGKRTASGAIFNNKGYTCAHKSLPFGTTLRITSIKTGKSVDVKVTDRGPFVKGRHIDLSKRAFFEIAPDKYGGHIRVNIAIIKRRNQQ